MYRDDAKVILTLPQAEYGQLPPADATHVNAAIGPHCNPYGAPGSAQPAHFTDRIELLRKWFGLG